MNLLNLVKTISTIKRLNKINSHGFSNGTNKSIGNYKTLRVIPRSQRTKNNCNFCGVENDKSN